MNFKKIRIYFLLGLLCSSFLFLIFPAYASPPTCSKMQINNNAALTNSTSVTLNLLASDADYVTEMQFSNDGIIFDPPVSYGTTKSWTLTSGDRTKTVYAKFKDSLGNWSDSCNDTITLDTTPPTTTADPEGGFYSSVNVTLSANETATIYYTINGADPSTNSTVYSVPIAITSDTTLKLFAKDSAGNIGAVKTEIYNAVPEGTININNGETHTNKTVVTLNLSATDANGVTEMQFSNDNSTWSLSQAYATTKSWILTSGDGTKTVYAKFKDSLGNWSDSCSDTITLDTTPPTTTADPEGGFYSSVNVTLSANETATIYYTINGADPSTNSTVYSVPIAITSGTTLKFFAKDSAGNIGAVKTEIYTIDDITPRGTVSINAGDPYTNNSAVTLNLSATDANGVTEMQFSNDNSTWSTPEAYAITRLWQLSSGDGTKTVYVKFKDAVGNFSVYEKSIMLAVTSPASKAMPYGGFYNTSQTVILDAINHMAIHYTTDGTTPTSASQIYSAPISITSTTALKFFAKNASGSETFHTEVYTIDNTPPIGSSNFQTLPKTGQTKCYNTVGTEITCAGTGQDGELQKGVAWPIPRFANPDGTPSVNGNIVFDKLTGLEWTKDAGTPTVGSCLGGTKTWQNALDYVACLNKSNYLGHNDWRLPNRLELESLMDFGRSAPALPSGHPFANVQTSRYWSSTADWVAMNAWYVELWNGYVNWSRKGTSYYIWPVRAGSGESLVNSIVSLFKTGQTKCHNSSGTEITCAGTGQDGELQKGVVWPDPRFTNPDGSTPVNGNIVLDKLTNLEWTKDAGTPTVGSCLGGTKTWQGTLDYVACLNKSNYLGHNDWRLPNRLEMESLMDFGKSAPALPSGHPFANVQVRSYNSSTTYTTETNSIFSVDMWYCGVLDSHKDNSSTLKYTWPVRSGQSGESNNTGILISSDTLTPKDMSVLLRFSATDANGVLKMMVSNNSEFSEATEEDFTVKKSWVLSPGDGTKTVYVKFKDAAGNWSDAYSASITLDVVGPTGSVKINNNAALTNKASATLTLPANDFSGVEEMKFSNDASTWSTPEGYAYTKDYVLPSGDGTKTVYVKYKDTTGKWSDAYSASIILDTTPPSLILSTLSNGSFTNNPTLNVAGSVSDNIALEKLTINNTEVTVKPDGSFSYAYTLTLGENTITIIARDRAGLERSDTRTVTYDATLPAITVTDPADNSKTNQPNIQIKGTIDESSSVTIVFNSSTPLFPVIAGNTFTVTTSLVYGINTFEITATDSAENRSTIKRTVIYDNEKPSLSIADPIQDIATNKKTITIKGTVTDLTPPNVTIAMDGQTFTPSITNGVFEQPLTFTTEKTYAVTVTATDELENSTSLVRNIIYDSTPAVFTVNPIATPTNKNSQTISGAMDEGATITVSCPYAVTGLVEYPTSTTWRVVISNLTEGDNQVLITAADKAGNSTETKKAIFYNPALLTLDLVAGWNLISLPMQPSDTAIATVLSGVSGKYTIVWAYTNSQWKGYDPSDTEGSDLVTMEAGKGYWMKMTSSDTLTITGTPPSTSLTLTEGWNLAGYNNTASASSSSVLSNISNKCQIVWAYMNSQWKGYDPSDTVGSDLTEFTPGYGYWVKTTEAVEWQQ